jgi:hypothetical protein
VQVVTLTFLILWVFSLWLLLLERRQVGKVRSLHPLPLIGGTVLFFLLSLAGFLYLRLLLAD